MGSQTWYRSSSTTCVCSANQVRISSYETLLLAEDNLLFLLHDVLDKCLGTMLGLELFDEAWVPVADAVELLIRRIFR